MAGNEKSPRMVRQVLGEKTQRDRILENLFLVLLVFYPLRHITMGLDLWDTGYNYANFVYMGTEHMDSMWLFSTYLANLVGHFLTKLPHADTLLGMNLYTGLFVSLLAVSGYFFCTRRLKYSQWVTFLGELAAISLCWCPTALLYNYLTYVLFLVAVLCIYEGLTKEKSWYLVVAGICLGSNIFVRFSNLPEAALILAVWYGCVLRYRKEGKGILWKKIGTITGYCLIGYLAAVCFWLVLLGIRYGFTAYFNGISRLFAMTDNATDYKATSMLRGIFDTYFENLYWVIRFGVILAAGVLFFVAGTWLQKQCKSQRTAKLVRVILIGGWSICCILVLLWLYYRKFCSFLFYSYDSMYRPGILFLMFTMFLALLQMILRKRTEEEKLMAALVLLVVLLTSIGSNNGVYPSLNNLFLAAPFTLSVSYRFIREEKREAAIPAKMLLVTFFVLGTVAFAGFGATFVFAEATGVQEAHSYVENNRILKGIRMSSDKAWELTSLTTYVKERNLTGKEVILYGNIPSLSYYLELPSAFNPWSDLRSYRAECMEEELEKCKEAAPLIILAGPYASFVEGGEPLLALQAPSEKIRKEVLQDQKIKLLMNYMRENRYVQTRKYANANHTYLIYEREMPAM